MRVEIRRAARVLPPELPPNTHVRQTGGLTPPLGAGGLVPAPSRPRTPLCATRDHTTKTAICTRAGVRNCDAAGGFWLLLYGWSPRGCRRRTHKLVPDNIHAQTDLREVPPHEGSGAGGKKGEKARETVGRKRTQFQKKINVHRLTLIDFYHLDPPFTKDQLIGLR